jgi:hypothetical protein
MYIYFYSDEQGDSIEEIKDPAFGEHAGLADTFPDTGAFLAFIYAGF